MPEHLPKSVESLIEQVAVRRMRMLRGQQENPSGFWRSIAIVGTIGWGVALPTLIGIAVGTWIDHRWPSRYSWTLMLLFAGLLLGCLESWTRITRAQEKR